MGPLHARITGMKRVRGEYFTFCDADDYYVNGKAFELLHLKCGRAEISPDMIQFGFMKKYNHAVQRVRITEQDRYIERNCFVRQEYPILLCSIWEESHLRLNVWNKIYRKDLLNRVPKELEEDCIFWGEDLILNLYLLESVKEVLYLPEILYVYRLFSGDTSRFKLDTMEQLDIVKKYQLLFLERRNLPDREKIRGVLFSEIAGWFLAFVRRAAEDLSHEQLVELIEKCLKLPRFILAKDYYREHPEIRMEMTDLLRNADAEEYIRHTDTTGKKRIKDRIIEGLKYIYKHI